jgi:hypothetical protein
LPITTYGIKDHQKKIYLKKIIVINFINQQNTAAKRLPLPRLDLLQNLLLLKINIMIDYPSILVPLDILNNSFYNLTIKNNKILFI